VDLDLLVASLLLAASSRGMNTSKFVWVRRSGLYLPRLRAGRFFFFFFKQKTAYEIGLGIPAEPLFRSFRDIGRMVLAAEGRKANDSHADCYQYFCVPEYGTANGRLHFHAVHFMRTLPTGSVDPNFGRRVRNRPS